MKAIILPTTAIADLAPLTSWVPEYLLPVVNKPVVEHLVELLARNQINDILFMIKHMPYETEQYFGDGSRWGVNITYSLLGNYGGMLDALSRLEPSKLEKPFLCLPANLVTDLDISEFVKFYDQGEGGVCRASTGTGVDQLQSVPTMAAGLAGMDCYPLIMTGQILKSLAISPDFVSSPTVSKRPDRELVPVKTYGPSGSSQRLTSLADLCTANRRVLAGEFKSILIPGKQIKPGLWLGAHSRIHPGARLETPLLIGNHCDIEKETCIGPASVIGDRVIIDEGASVQESLVLSGTYVGAYTEIKDSLLKKNWMFQVPRELHVHLGDDLILGNLEQRPLVAKAGRLLNLLLAMLLLVLTSPLWGSLLCYHLMFPAKQFFLTEKRLRVRGQLNLDGQTQPQAFDLFLFRSPRRFIRKLPGLFNVLRGDLNMVGISALDETEYDRLPEEWRDMRAHAPLGLFHLWELEDRRDDLEWEEKMVMENYYATVRSLPLDLKVLGRALMAAMRG